MTKKAVFILLMFCSMVFSCGGGGGAGSETNTALPAPQNVLSAGGNGQAYLSWKDVSGATTYNIYWSTTTGVDKQSGTKFSVAASPYYHSGLNNGTSYYYVVTAVNQYGESTESFEVSASPGQFTPPLPPRDVASFSLHRSVIIRWTALEAGDVNTSYNIYWSTSKGVTKRSGIKIADAASPLYPYWFNQRYNLLLCDSRCQSIWRGPCIAGGLGHTRSGEFAISPDGGHDGGG
jgi:hypothetical protein